MRAENGRARTLVLLRHGQSTANAENTFSGWLDVALTGRGEQEAARAATLLRDGGVYPDVVHTSVLWRAIRTADLLLDALGAPWTPTMRSWRLNERHYGALQGRSKAEVRAEAGDELFMRWRRSYDQAPPALPSVRAAEIAADGRYRALPPGTVPATESLADVRRRVEPYWQDVLAADLHDGKVPLVVAHGNSLRALCMLLDGLSPDDVAGLNIPTGVPLRYDLDHTWRPMVPGGQYLDPAAAAAGAAEVAAQGTRPAQ
jgi:2,3-bisphosphoglycerate-dependent phosphoglycerate mutase